MEYVRYIDGKFEIPEENIDAVVVKIYEEEKLEHIDFISYLPNIFRLREYVYEIYNIWLKIDEGVVGLSIRTQYELMYLEEIENFLGEIVEFIKEGSYLVFSDCKEFSYRFSIKDKKVVKEKAKIAWESC